MSRAAGLLALVAGLALSSNAALAETEAAVHHDLEVRLDPETRHLAVTDVVTVKDRDAFVFRLHDGLELLEVRLAGRPAEVERRFKDLVVALPDSGPQEITLRYEGQLAPLPSGRGERSGWAAVSGADGAYLPAYARWMATTEDYWISYRLRFEVPAAYRAVTSGRLLEERLDGETYRAVFVAKHPAEPPSLFVGPYRVREAQSGDIRLRSYFHPELEALAEPYLEQAAAYLRRFEAEIGPYAFEDFHIISAPLPVGLGFPNLTYIGRRIVPLPFMRGRSLAHEVLHNWWGNGVTVDYARGNWSEGLTTYMADYALAADEGPARAREMRLAWLRDYAALPPERDHPVTQFTVKRHDAAQVIGYNKVAFIFHMLKQEIGAAAFEAALRELWQQRRFQVTGWDDLRRYFEQASGRDLGWFFTQWLERAGAPRVEMVSAEAAESGFSLTLRQDAPAYRLSLPVVVETTAGMEHHRVAVEGAEVRVSLATEARPLAAHVDPEHEVFRRLLPGEAHPILRDVTLAQNAVTVLATADALDEEVATDLAWRLLDGPGKLFGPETLGSTTEAALVIGTTTEVGAALRGAGLPEVPASLERRGSARVWTLRRPGGAPLLAVAADDAEALRALLRPLPHYGGKSYLVFEGRRAVETGVWPSQASPLSRRFE